MRRRTLLKHAAGIAAAAAAPAATDALDRFGGLRAVRFEPSGFFRVEQSEGRWWFVTPDGSAFLSFGLNHPNKDYLRQPYNVEHWKKRFGVDDPQSREFVAAFAARAMSDLKKFGMNTLGCHAIKPDFGNITVPYIQGLFFVRSAYWLVRGPESFLDVFSDAFVQRCENQAGRVVAARKDDPFLMGYTFTNVPILTDEDAKPHGIVPWGRAQPAMPTWPRSLRNLGASAPGKQTYVALMRKRHASIERFNRLYNTSFGSFETLAAAERWSPFVRSDSIDDAADNHAFLLEILERYYQVASAAVRKLDTNHMIFGDPLNANTPPPDDVVELMGRHCDLIDYQFYGEFDDHVDLMGRWPRLTGKPLLHGDSCFSVPSEKMPEPVGVHRSSHPELADTFWDFATRTIARPELLGWHWCGYMDSWKSFRPEQQHPGLQDPFGRYHHPMPETMARFGSEIYQHGRPGS